MNPFIDTILEKLSKYDFSQLEKVIYAYDYITDDDIILEKSESLKDVLAENKIRCNIKDNRVVIYIDDDKYNVNGLYIIDNFDKNIFSRYNFLSRDNNYTSDIMFNNEELIYFDENEDSINDDFMNKVNFLSEIIDNKKLITKEINYSFKEIYTYNKQQVFLDLNKYGVICNKRILADTLVDALFDVRKKQYLENGDKYPFSKNGFIQTIVESNWKFCNRNESLLFNLFHISINMNDEASNYFEKNDIEESINDVKKKKITK